MKFIECEYDDAVNIDYIVNVEEWKDDRNYNPARYFVKIMDRNAMSHTFRGTLEDFYKELRRLLEDG